jgi:5-methylcytosine-specific restriction enzyme B
VLLIDEINRGNLAKVFGELYFLLEYRGEKVRLQYSEEPFALPKNVWVIATMNTADRSIALIDAALRRRFYFVPFFPDEPPVKGLLCRWLNQHKPDLAWVADVVDRANGLLGDRHAAIGASHFLRHDLTERWVSLIWKHAVLPYLEELLRGDEDRLRDFDLEQLRAGVSGRLEAV